MRAPCARRTGVPVLALACALASAASCSRAPDPESGATHPRTTRCALAPKARGFRDRVELFADPKVVTVRVEHHFGIDDAVVRCPAYPSTLVVDFPGFTMLESFGAAATQPDGRTVTLPFVMRGDVRHVFAEPNGGLERVDVLEPFGATIDTSRVPPDAEIHLNWIDAYR